MKVIDPELYKTLMRLLREKTSEPKVEPIKSSKVQPIVRPTKSPGLDLNFLFGQAIKKSKKKQRRRK